MFAERALEQLASGSNLRQIIMGTWDNTIWNDSNPYEIQKPSMQTEKVSGWASAVITPYIFDRIIIVNKEL